MELHVGYSTSGSHTYLTRILRSECLMGICLAFLSALRTTACSRAPKDSPAAHPISLDLSPSPHYTKSLRSSLCPFCTLQEPTQLLPPRTASLIYPGGGLLEHLVQATSGRFHSGAALWVPPGGEQATESWGLCALIRRRCRENACGRMLVISNAKRQ